MTEYKDNETVTISLERYTELTNNQKDHYDFSPEFREAVNKYIEENKIVVVYHSEKRGNIELMSREKAIEAGVIKEDEVINN